MIDEVDMAERFEERAGIIEYCGLLTRQQAEDQAMLESEEYRLACEVRAVLKMPLDERREYLAGCEKKRGKPAADKLRDSVRAEWERRKRREEKNG